MSESAHVTSIDAIARFASAMRGFEEQAARSLVSIDEQARGALNWLEHDAPLYWRQQVRLRLEGVTKARLALEACERKGNKDFRPSCAEEKEALRIAQRRVREAEEKVEAVRRWAQKLRHEMDEYRGRVMALRTCLEAELPRTIALLDRTVAALDAYAERAAGEPPKDSSANSGGNSGAGQ